MGISETPTRIENFRSEGNEVVVSMICEDTDLERLSSRFSSWIDSLMMSGCSAGGVGQPCSVSCLRLFEDVRIGSRTSESYNVTLEILLQSIKS